LPTTR